MNSSGSNAVSTRSRPSTIWKGPFRFSRLLNRSPRPISQPGRRNAALQLEANMGEVIRFIPKAERDRIRLIREARAKYDSIFPPSDPLTEQREESPISAANVRRGDEALS